jgi:hypothetical protein
VFISKKKRVNNMRVSPINSLIRSPPHKERRKIFSDLCRLNLISRNPIKKFNNEISAPINIDLNSIAEILSIKYNTIRTRKIIIEIKKH